MELVHLLLLFTLIIPSITCNYLIGGRSLLLVNGTYNWYRGNDICVECGMRMLEIRNRAEQDQLMRLVRHYKINHLWLGGSMLAGNGGWKWVSTGRFITYLPWSTGEPSGANAFCLDTCSSHPSDEYTWTAMPCYSLLTVLCQESDAQIESKRIKTELESCRSAIEKTELRKENCPKSEPVKCPEVKKNVEKVLDTKQEVKEVKVKYPYVLLIIFISIVILVTITRNNQKKEAKKTVNYVNNEPDQQYEAVVYYSNADYVAKSTPAIK